MEEVTENDRKIAEETPGSRREGKNRKIAKIREGQRSGGGERRSYRGAV